MDSNKDFARSKRRATQRHKPGRGGFSGVQRSTAKAELGTNAERYRDESEVPTPPEGSLKVPRSQGADLTSLLQEDHTEFRQRGTFFDDAEALPTSSGENISNLDLNIDLQGLADSLSKLPIWTLLKLDADLCQSFVHDASQEAEPGTNRHHDTPLRPSISSSTTGAAAKISSNIQSTASNALDLASEVGPAASTTPVLDQPEAKSTSIDSKTRLSSALPTEKSIKADAAPPQQKWAPEKGKEAPPGDEHLELDDLLNAHDSAVQPTSTAITKPQSQDQDSLEDWLNSL